MLRDKVLYGMPVIIAGCKKQRKIHKKKRINKKWAKQYGFDYYSPIEDGKWYIFDGKIYVGPRTYERLCKRLNERKWRKKWYEAEN